MPPRLPDDQREAILADIRAGGKSRNQVARDHGVSVGTVSNIAKQAGLTDAFDRSQTKNATEAAVADNKALRASTSRRFLEEANRLLDELHTPHMVFNIGGKDNVYTEHLLPEPPTVDKRNLIVSAATAFDKHMAAERHDSDDQHGLSAVDDWLRGVIGGQ